MTPHRGASFAVMQQAHRRDRRALHALRALMAARLAEERRLREHVEVTCDQLRAELAHQPTCGTRSCRGNVPLGGTRQAALWDHAQFVERKVEAV